MDYKRAAYTLRVFTAFSGYDSQCMALDRIGLPYDLVGWSEIDKYAIAAHNAIYPQFTERNYGDISQIDWSQVPDFDLFTYSSPCQDFSAAGLQRGEVPAFRECGSPRECQVRKTIQPVATAFGGLRLYQFHAGTQRKGLRRAAEPLRQALLLFAADTADKTLA